jgi:N-terminal domain of anti-restriction factor ArdC
MAKQKRERNQLTFEFGSASVTPISSGNAAIVHAHLPPPELPLILEESEPAPSLPTEVELPAPKPLPSAVKKAVFGVDDNDDPIDPSEEEVHEISQLHGDRLTELFQELDDLKERLKNSSATGRETLIRDKERLTCQVQGMLAIYAEDFGEPAARHLESWARHQAQNFDRLEDKPTKPKRDETVPKEAKATRAEKLNGLHETVDRALDDLAQALDAGRSETLKNWLKTMSHFHNYSLNNQMLIAWQRPDATHVAGFNAWKKFNRIVRKGEKGIMILAPVTRVVGRAESSEGDEGANGQQVRQLVNTKVAYVFDISQTYGEPLPELTNVRGNPATFTERLKDVIRSRGIELYTEERLGGGAQGRSEGGRIGIVQGLEPAEEFRTLAHELAHELLHRGERRSQTTKRTRELEAESVAFVVCSAIGLDARQTSSDYIQLYRGDKATLLESLQFIRNVAQDILSAIDPKPREASR